MSILRKPDDPCGACGERPRLTLHDDGSIRGTLHVCARALPGPPDPPRVYPKGQHWPQAQDWRGPLCECGHDAVAHLDFVATADCLRCACPRFTAASEVPNADR